MNRWEIERHIDRAALPAPSKGILRALCTRMHGDTGFIERRFSPSIRALARMTGLDKATVCRHLNLLEKNQWIVRHRPPVVYAQQLHITTRYEIHVPFFYPQAGRTLPPDLVAEDDEAGRRARDALVAERDEAGRAVRRKSPEDTSSTEIVIRPDDDSLAEIAREELAAATGRTITMATARETVRLVLAGRAVSNPAAYLRRAIRQDARRFLPSPSGPPQFRDGRFIER